MTGVVQEAGRAGAALDLDQAEPAGAEGVDHVGRAELRDLVPASIAARMIEVPSGTVTALAVDGQRHHRCIRL